MRESAFSIRRQPLLYITASLIAGIVFERAAEPSRPMLVGISVLCACACLKFIANRQDARVTTALLVGFAALGALLSSGERNISDSRLVALFQKSELSHGDAVELTGVIAGPPEPAPGATYLDIEAESVRADRRDFPASGHVRAVLYSTDREELDGLAYGSRIRI